MRRRVLISVWQRLRDLAARLAAITRCLHGRINALQTHTHTHTHSPHLYNPPPCSVLGCAPVSIRGQELIGGPGAFSSLGSSLLCLAWRNPLDKTPRYVVNSITPHITAGNICFPYHRQTCILNLQRVRGWRAEDVSVQKHLAQRPASGSVRSQFETSDSRITDFNLLDCLYI